jgi:hypothetical protein
MRIWAIGTTALSVVMLCVGATTVAAEVIVIGSDFDGYKIGSRLSDDPKLDIPVCRTLVLLNEGKFVELPGPYKGPLSRYQNAKVHCGQLTFEERQNWYDYYFKNICAKTKRCDKECKEVFDRVEQKDKLSFKCE